MLFPYTFLLFDSQDEKKVHFISLEATIPLGGEVSLIYVSIYTEIGNFDTSLLITQSSYTPNKCFSFHKHPNLSITTMASDRGVFLNKSWGVGGREMKDRDFDEEDVWSVANDDSGKETTRACKESCGSSSSSSAWRLPAAPRKIPRANNNANPLPAASDAPLVKGSSSAPMDIPDWSKIYGKSCKKGSTADDGASNKGGDDDDDDDDDMVPPHEWIARKLARSQISSFSVCEGIGRTLKGRDLSKVRNAILTKTGFIE